MNEPSRSTGDFAFTLILAGAFLILLWWKKRRQFGHAIPLARVYVHDTLLRCQICEGETFRKREGLVNTTWMTLLKLDPLNESAHCLTCLRCGHAHWFMRRGPSEPGQDYPNAWIRYEISAARPPSIQ
jgi:hypothetical protein